MRILLHRCIQSIAPLMVVASALTVACSSSQRPTEPSAPADIAGRITAIVPVGSFVGTIRVETNPSASSGSPKAIATINGRTVILLRTGEESAFRSLSVGQWVRVWFNGPVAESYPVQGTAATVVIDSVSVSVVQ